MNYSARPPTFIDKACCVVVKYMHVSHHVPVYAIFLGFPYGFPGCTGLYTGFMVEDSLFLLRERERERNRHELLQHNHLPKQIKTKYTHSQTHDSKFVGLIYKYIHTRCSIHFWIPQKQQSVAVFTLFWRTMFNLRIRSRFRWFCKVSVETQTSHDIVCLIKPWVSM